MLNDMKDAQLYPTRHTSCSSWTGLQDLSELDLCSVYARCTRWMLAHSLARRILKSNTPDDESGLQSLTRHGGFLKGCCSATNMAAYICPIPQLSMLSNLFAHLLLFLSIFSRWILLEETGRGTVHEKSPPPFCSFFKTTVVVQSASAL